MIKVLSFDFCLNFAILLDGNDARAANAGRSEPESEDNSFAAATTASGRPPRRHNGRVAAPTSLRDQTGRRRFTAATSGLFIIGSKIVILEIIIREILIIS